MTKRWETCERCQGNGEIVTDWDAYLHPANLAAEENSVTECPDCGGTGKNPDGPEVTSQDGGAAT